MTQNQQYPRVAVMITARNRPDELQRTLRELKQQTYPNMQVVVIDDASEPSLEQLVRSEWPDGVFIRNEKCRGLIANRNTVMQSAKAEFIVSLDDDSCFTRADDLSLAVARMQAEPQAGLLSFRVYAGPDPVPADQSALREQYVPSFIGCGHMIRSAVVEQIGGYRDFFFYYGEEADYSLRIWDGGWRILFVPGILIHHRVSSANRNRGGILRYSIRNNLWTTLLNLPFPRVAIQMLWRLFSYTLESFRLLEFRAWVSGLAGFIGGIPMILKLRRPVRQKTLTLLDAITTRELTDPEELDRIEPVGRIQFLQVSFRKWIHRPRARSFWDRRAGDKGRGETMIYSHNLPESGSTGAANGGTPPLSGC